MTGCGCGGCAATAAASAVENPPGQSQLNWRAAPYPAALERMKALLAGSEVAAARVLAQHGPDEPAIALLDAWALVTDTVSFYTERLATEGFLRTATELVSVRQLARTLGYELRPGVSAQAQLSFTVEDAAGAPPVVTVPAGTPVQTVPAAGQLPQTFETAAELEARAVWNAIPALSTEPQVVASATTTLWVRGTGLGLRDGEVLAALGQQRRDAPAAATSRIAAPPPQPPTLPADMWFFFTITAVAENPDGRSGWTRLSCARRESHGRGFTPLDPPVEVFRFAARSNLFGWNAPDPTLLALDETVPPADADGDGEWDDFEVAVGDGLTIELDGEQPRLIAGSWLVLEGHDPDAGPPAPPAGSTRAQLYGVTSVLPSGAARYGLSGRITRVGLDLDTTLSDFTRRTAAAYTQSVLLPTGEQPRSVPIAGGTIEVAASDPLLPVGRSLLVTGLLVQTGRPGVETTTVIACMPSADGTTMTLRLDPPLVSEYDPQTLSVQANVVTASHGETVQQPLGSGDGRLAFQQFTPRRAPLSYLRASTPEGAASTMSVRVDAVEWSEVASLDTATGNDRAYTVKRDEGGAVRIGFGDGTHGARLTTGPENVTATYRVGIGADGAAVDGQLTLLPRRPLGIRSVSNPGAATDWAPPETLDDARRNAPLRIRTLDRAVSVADHEDFAAGYAGVGTARADAVWDGHRQVVAVCVLGTDAVAVSTGLLADLRAALDAARDPAAALEVLGGDLVWFGVRVDLLTDPAYLRADVEQAVLTALQEHLGHAARTFTAAVSAAEALVVVTAVAGVTACTMPRLVPLPDPPGVPPLPTDRSDDVTVLAARPARFEAGTLQPAQLLGLADGGVEIRVMTS